MRNIQHLELIYDSSNKQMVEINEIVLGGLAGSIDSKTLVMRYFYHDILFFVNIE